MAGPRVDAPGRLIVALDVPSVAEARDIVSELEGVVSFYKVGLHIQWDDSFKPLVLDLLNAGKEVFIDYKYADIGATMQSHR